MEPIGFFVLVVWKAIVCIVPLFFFLKSTIGKKDSSYRIATFERIKILWFNLWRHPHLFFPTVAANIF
jgi:hypothetical protein